MRQTSRREFLRLFGVGTAAGLAGCNGLVGGTDQRSGVTVGPDRTATGSDATATPSPRPVAGRLEGVDGTGIADASVRALVPGVGTVGTTTSGGDGHFSVSTGGSPVWLRVDAADYHPRTVAAAPGDGPRVRLVARQGTVALTFGGDVMFGRRFYEPADALEPHHRIRPDRLAADHARALTFVAPAFRTADVASVNLETPLTTTDWRHPEKRYTFVSDPAAAPALADAGIDYVALGNNHVFDALTPGLRDTRRALERAGLKASGAGESSAAAWSPARVDVRDQSVGLLSCTTVVGGGYRLDWSADRDTPSTTVTAPTGDRRLTVGGESGTAEASVDRLTAAVSALAGRVDVTVVQLHGGEEYHRTPTATVERLSTAAAAAGADVVVVHHPHVTGGVTVRHGAVIAWSLGNLVFDQELWETFPTYLLTVYAGANGVAGAVVDPVLVEGYLPKAVVGEPREAQLWRTAGLSGPDVTLTPTHLRYAGAPGPRTTGAATAAPPTGRAERRTERRSLDPRTTPAVYARAAGWVDDVPDGTAVTLGRDRLPTGRFENPDVDDAAYEGPLWRFGRGDGVTGPDVGRDGSGGVRLVREADNSQRKILTPAERVPVTGPATLFVTYRFDATAGLELLVRWYESTSGDAVASATTALTGTDGTWRRVHREVTPPVELEEGAGYVRAYLRLAPPDGDDGRRVARIDEVRLVEWAPDAGGGREYDHLRVEAPATVTFATATGAANDAISWPPLDQ